MINKLKRLLDWLTAPMEPANPINRLFLWLALGLAMVDLLIAFRNLFWNSEV